MKVFIVYCHPDPQSFTRMVLDTFREALECDGHSCQVSDLAAMNFKSDLSYDEYTREAYYRDDLPLPEDVKTEQAKINWSQVMVFIYPVF
ncbi:MAG: NAD(P)H-dependent oxidoreductase, partial [Candidatus Delongbacteria bacterium]|nr:NAD(P)H-dependent oxidoreductase [Candidatus Delongbacteria bacterium]